MYYIFLESERVLNWEKKKECYCVVNDCIGLILVFCEKMDFEFGVEDGKCLI